ncbi:MAG: hypothetical protein ACYCZR_02625 [Burkholderiales bacterium]
MTSVSASLCLMLHKDYAEADDAARALMKSAIWELVEPMMREAVSRGMKIEAFVEQLTSQEKDNGMDKTSGR